MAHFAQKDVDAKRYGTDHQMCEHLRTTPMSVASAWSSMSLIGSSTGLRQRDNETSRSSLRHDGNGGLLSQRFEVSQRADDGG